MAAAACSSFHQTLTHPSPQTTPSFIIKSHLQNPDHDDPDQDDPDSKPVSQTNITNHISKHRSSDSFSSMNSESLQMCTEGLGFESSFDDVNDPRMRNDVETLKWDNVEKCSDDESSDHRVLSDQIGRRRDVRVYPPPISCIGRSGKPSVWFEKTKEDGRFVIRQIRMPALEFLRASRENGRLRLCLVHPEMAEEAADEEGDQGGEFDDDEGDETENGECRGGEGEMVSRSEMYDKAIDDS